MASERLGGDLAAPAPQAPLPRARTGHWLLWRRSPAAVGAVRAELGAAAGGPRGGEGRERAPGPRANGLRRLSARCRVPPSARPRTVPATGSALAHGARLSEARRGARFRLPTGIGARGALSLGKEGRGREGGAPRSQPAALPPPRFLAGEWSSTAPLPADSLGRGTGGRSELCDPPRASWSGPVGSLRLEGGCSRQCPRKLSASSSRSSRGPAGVGGR